MILGFADNLYIKFLRDILFQLDADSVFFGKRFTFFERLGSKIFNNL